MIKFYFFSEGRVDAYLIQINEKYIFVDSGFRSNGLSSIKKMKKLGITKLDYYVGTHGHMNHIGGAGAIIKALSPAKVYIPHARVKEAIIKHAKSGSERNAASKAQYQILKPTESFVIDEYIFTCIGPLSIKKCSPGLLSENYNSMILRVDYNDKHIALLTGDTSSGILESINKKNPGSIKASLLKNPHHNGAQTEKVLKLIDPDVIVVCNSSRSSSSYRKRMEKIGADYYHACKGSSADFAITYTDLGWEVSSLKEALK